MCEIVTRTDQRVKREMSEGDVYRAVREALRSMHGDFGVGSIGISLRGSSQIQRPELFAVVPCVALEQNEKQRARFAF